MKPIHFSQEPSPHFRQQFHRWMYMSVFAIGSIVLGLSFYSGLQYWEYIQLKHEYALLQKGSAGLDACLERKRDLKQKHEALNARLIRLNRVKHKPKNPFDVIATIQNYQGISVQDMLLRKKKIDLAITAEDTAHLLAYAEHLKHAFNAQVDITSIEQSGKVMKALLQIERA
jgi:hypothetical protein